METWSENFRIWVKEKVKDIKSTMEMLDDIIVENLKSQYEEKLAELKLKKAHFIKRREFLVKLETESQGSITIKPIDCAKW